LTYGDFEYEWFGRELRGYTDTYSGVSAEFVYGYDGLRTKKLVSDGTYVNEYDYLWSPYDGKLVSYNITLGETSESVTVMILRDENDEPFGITLNEQAFYYIKNLQGDVVRVVDANGDTVLDYLYDAWGNITFDFGTDAELAEMVYLLNPIAYRGYYYDCESGLYYARSKYYNAAWGRIINGNLEKFTSRKSSLNPSPVVLYDDQEAVQASDFAFAENNPVMNAAASSTVTIPRPKAKDVGFNTYILYCFADMLVSFGWGHEGGYTSPIKIQNSNNNLENPWIYLYPEMVYYLKATGVCLTEYVWTVNDSSIVQIERSGSGIRATAQKNKEAWTTISVKTKNSVFPGNYSSSVEVFVITPLAEQGIGIINSNSTPRYKGVQSSKSFGTTGTALNKGARVWVHGELNVTINGTLKQYYYVRPEKAGAPFDDKLPDSKNADNFFFVEKSKVDYGNTAYIMLRGNYPTSRGVHDGSDYRAIDINGEGTGINIRGESLYALANGTLQYKAKRVQCACSSTDQYYVSYGAYAEITYDNGYKAYYCHLLDFANGVNLPANTLEKHSGPLGPLGWADAESHASVPSDVTDINMGSPISVTKGQLIGQVGDSGNSSGNHLHFFVHNSSNKSPFSTDAEALDYYQQFFPFILK